MRKWPSYFLKGMIRFYRSLISPLMPAACRFYPTCSAYALEAIERHGALKGGILSGLRLLKCHPWHKGPMIDPVPYGIDWLSLIGYKRARKAHGPDCGCNHHNENLKERTDHAKP